MTNHEEAKVSRYNTVGKEIQNIRRDNQGEELYSDPHYIAENINGDICTSDYDKQAVVVVNKSGQHTFSYTGQESEFYLWGICTDLFGNILVCDSFGESIHLLDQNGGFQSFVHVHSQQSGFLSSIFSLDQHENIKHPRGVCVDDENNLYVGQFNINRVKVYKYIQ
uniref:RING finger protein nhl-1-like n=1 Tax=Crassostrea virginica TaxID=6565 RepID=A0A8B8E9A4_CRAVI|nr:RING finger protein nhl-1-like [Crassostrea virginica]